MVFGWMRVLAIPLHQMSATGLVIALGLLIDNAIVVVDEVQQRLRTGAATGEAVRQSVGYLLVPILMTATLVLSFRSFRMAVLIASVALLSVGLAALALKLSGSVFGFTAILGTLGLIGLAINDSIVVLNAIRTDPLAAVGDPAATTAGNRNGRAFAPHHRRGGCQDVSADERQFRPFSPG